MTAVARTTPYAAVAYVALGLAGVACCAALPPETVAPPLAWVVLIAVVGAACVPAVARPMAAALDRARRPSDRAARLTAGIVAVVATAYLFMTAVGQDRDLAPRWHDEFMHLLQIRQMAAGRLWLPPHPLADFFESFHMFARPVYASIYFPGASLFYLPTAWLNLDHWLMPLLACGLAVGLTYRAVTLAADGVAGLLAAAWVLALPQFRMLSFMVMSHQVMLVLGLSAVLAYARWRRSPTPGRAAVVGGLLGWAAVTRPVDAICFALPIGLAMLWRLFCEPKTGAAEVPAAAGGTSMRPGAEGGAASSRRGRRLATTAAVLVLAAGPFLSMQLVLNRGVTGRWLQTPWQRYVEVNQPQFAYGDGQFDAAVRPASALPQKHAYFDQFVVPSVRARATTSTLSVWANDRLPTLARVVTPTTALLALALPGLLCLTTVPRWLLFAPLPLLYLLYTPFPQFLDHYAVVVAPAAALLAGLGRQRLADAFPRWRAPVDAGSAVAVVGLVLLSLPQVTGARGWEVTAWPTMSYVHHDLPAQVQAPAVVLFRYRPNANPHEEPVYNVATLSPDDAAIVRAHDLGPRNAELFAHYAAHQPDRNVYRFDRGDGAITFLGKARDLAGPPAVETGYNPADRSKHHGGH